MSTRLPVAHCAKDGHVGTWLQFERCPYTRNWTVQCPDCCDGEPDGETGFMRALNEIGSGETPFSALIDYAEKCNVDANELTVTEPHV